MQDRQFSLGEYTELYIDMANHYVYTYLNSKGWLFRVAWVGINWVKAVDEIVGPGKN